MLTFPTEAQIKVWLEQVHTYVSPWRKLCVLRFVGVARTEHMERTVTGSSGEGPPQL